MHPASPTLPAWQTELDHLKYESDQLQARVSHLIEHNDGHVVSVSEDGRLVRDRLGSAYYCTPEPSTPGAIVPVVLNISVFGGEKFQATTRVRILRVVPITDVSVLWKRCQQKPLPGMAIGQWWEVIAD